MRNYISLIAKDLLIANQKERTGEPDEKVFVRWKKLINMTSKELKEFINSEEGQEAGLSRTEADKLDINSGRESAKMILRMLPYSSSFQEAEKNWTPSMWYWARRQNSFNARMLGNKGPLFDDKGNKTRKHLSLLIWGHNPKK